MKTVLHLPSASAGAARPRPPVHGWRPTIRLGLVLSVVAAAAAAALRAATHVPGAILISAVAVVGFVLSWHETWHTHAPPDRSEDAPTRSP